MIHNPDKCHFLTVDFSDFSFENTIIKKVVEENILGILIDNNLKFKSHMKKICKKAQPKTQCTCKNFKIKNSYSEKKINKFFYQCTIYFMSFDIDVSFKWML